MYMNNQLKLLVYIVFLVAVFFYIQDNFKMFDVSFLDGKNEVSESIDEGKEEKKGSRDYVEIYLSDGKVIEVDVEVADTDALRTLGLSNRRYLGDYNGMLFVFNELGNYPFWMKDTYINLDIIFIDEKGFIVDMAEDNEPCSDMYCPVIASVSNFKYVLEVNGKFAKNNGVVVGQSIVIHLASD